MASNRRPLSLVASLALGLGAALLVLLAGGRPAAAAPDAMGDSKPAPLAQCFARDDSNTATIYQSANSAAVRQAVAAAVPSDTVRLAGNCAGVATQGNTSQTVVITQALTLIGGYNFGDWANSFPITQPTTLDALGLGRVITASSDLTIAAMTVQNGQSFGGNGGGVYAGGNLTSLGAVNFLSNTTLVSTTQDSPAAPASVCCFGGGYFAQGQTHLGQAATQLNFRPSSAYTGNVVFQNNSAYNGAAGYSVGQARGDYVTVSNNHSQEYGSLVVLGTGTFDYLTIDGNTGNLSAGVVLGLGGSVQDSTCTNNNAGTGTCILLLGLAPGTIILRNDIVSGNGATNDGAVVYSVGMSFVLDKLRVVNNTVAGSGNVATFFDSSGSVTNSYFAGNTTAAGTVFSFHDFVPAPPTSVELLTIVNNSPFLQSAGPTNPLGSAVAPTGTAIYASGATVLVSDTIIAGYATDLATDGAISSAIVADYNLFGQTPVISGTGIITGMHSLIGNPLFADALGHLSAGSPAIDHGIDVNINVDFDGNHRPSGAGFDIGAYEFQLIRLFLPLVRR